MQFIIGANVATISGSILYSNDRDWSWFKNTV